MIQIACAGPQERNATALMVAEVVTIAIDADESGLFQSGHGQEAAMWISLYRQTP